MTKEPTAQQVNDILMAIMLDNPVPHDFPEVEAELRAEVAEIERAGLTVGVTDA